MVKKYEKLVRDNIPDIIKKQNRMPIVRELSNDEYHSCLNKKLLEEVNEYLENNCIEELCDILEVIEALTKYMNYTQAEVQNIKSSKALKNGRFEKKLFLEEVIE